MGPPPSVAVIGTGEVGLRLCAHLVDDGRAIAAYDRRPSALERAVARGARGCRSARDAALDVPFCILAVGGERDVQELVLSEGGLASSMTAGSIVISATDSHPGVTRQLGQVLAARGISMLDAALSEGIGASDHKALLVAVGGDDETFERSRDVLQSLATTVFHAGELGSASTVNALSTLLRSAALVATAEALAITHHWNIPDETTLAVLNASSGRSHASSVDFPRFVMKASFDSGLQLGAAHKSLLMLSDIAREMPMPTPMVDRVLTVYNLVSEGLGPTVDNTQIARYVAVLTSGS